MDTQELISVFQEENFEPESWEKIQIILSDIQTAGTINAEHLDQLSAVMDFEEELANAEADAMDQIADALDEHADELHTMFEETADEMEKLVKGLEDDLANA